VARRAMVVNKITYPYIVGGQVTTDSREFHAK
jgi:hypothetical protein